MIKLKQKKKQKLLRSLKKALWKLISYYIRFSQANFNGMVKCYTCNKLIKAKEANAGHFFHNKLDFDLRNLRPQCVGCNLFKHGNLGIYAKKLIKENGIEWLEQLERDAIKKGNSYSREEIMILTRDFKLKNENIKSEYLLEEEVL